MIIRVAFAPPTPNALFIAPLPVCQGGCGLFSLPCARDDGEFTAADRSLCSVCKSLAPRGVPMRAIDRTHRLCRVADAEAALRAPTRLVQRRGLVAVASPSIVAVGTGGPHPLRRRTALARRNLVDREPRPAHPLLAGVLGHIPRQQPFPEFALALFRRSVRRRRNDAARALDPHGRGDDRGDGAAGRAPQSRRGGRRRGDDGLVLFLRQLQRRGARLRRRRPRPRRRLRRARAGARPPRRPRTVGARGGDGDRRCSGIWRSCRRSGFSR